MELLWEETFPGKEFSYYFLDEDFERQYQQEKLISKLVFIFTILGIIIASLGLIGMISFSLENRKKEIGIRKVNGAQIKHVYGLLIRNFSWQILIAFLVACPVAWFGGKAWLQDFIKDPQAVSPWSIMPKYDLSREELSNLADYVLSLDFDRYGVKSLTREDIQ